MHFVNDNETLLSRWLPRWLYGKEPTCQCRRLGRHGRAPGGGHGDPLQYSCLENPADRGAWRAMVHRVAKNRTWLKRLSTHTFSSDQFSHSVVSDSLWPHELQHARPPYLSPNSWSLPKLMSIESVMPSNHLILCHRRLLLPSIFPSFRVFSHESTLLIRWPKYWSFSFNISTSNEHPGLISFRMDWLDILTVQGTLKSLLQHHSSKASILRCSAFFIVQLLHPYMTTGKTIALTRRTFVDKVMSQLFNILSRGWS